MATNKWEEKGDMERKPEPNGSESRLASSQGQSEITDVSNNMFWVAERTNVPHFTVLEELPTKWIGHGSMNKS